MSMRSGMYDSDPPQDAAIKTIDTAQNRIEHFMDRYCLHSRTMIFGCLSYAYLYITRSITSTSRSQYSFSDASRADPLLVIS